MSGKDGNEKVIPGTSNDLTEGTDFHVIEVQPLNELQDPVPPTEPVQAQLEDPAKRKIPVPPEIAKIMGIDPNTEIDPTVQQVRSVADAGENNLAAALADELKEPGDIEVDGSLPFELGPLYGDDAWGVRLPYIMEKLGIQAGQKMDAPTVVIKLNDGRTYDVFLALHKLCEVLVLHQNKFMELFGGINKTHEVLAGAQSVMKALEGKVVEHDQFIKMVSGRLANKASRRG